MFPDSPLQVKLDTIFCNKIFYFFTKARQTRQIRNRQGILGKNELPSAPEAAMGASAEFVPR